MKYVGWDNSQERVRKRGRRHTHKRSKSKSCLNVIFANVATLSSEAMDFVTNPVDCHVISSAETHKRGKDLQKCISDFRVAGWDPIAALAEQSDRSDKGTFARMMMATVKSVEATIPIDVDASTMCVEGSNIIHQTIRIKGSNAHVIFVYLKDKIGLTGYNRHHLEEIAKNSRGRNGYSLVVVDVNVRPDTMINFGHPEILEPIASGTCRNSHGGKDSVII